MSEGSFYSVTTRRFRLRCGHEDWLGRTQQFYNQILSFYYNLFLDSEEERHLSELGSWQILRELEVLTITGRDKKPVPFPIPWDKVPLYFRRAAINNAVAAAKGFLARNDSRSKAAEEMEGLDKGDVSCIQERRASDFCEAATFYKGMYRNLDNTGVELKVWDGERWRWIHCRLSGNRLPEDCVKLSPAILFRGNTVFLDVPVRQSVQDGRRAAERFRKGTRLCSIQFGSGDVFAVGVVMDSAGGRQSVRFYRGGLEYAHRCRQVLHKIELSDRAMGREDAETNRGTAGKGACQGVQEYNRKYWMKLKNLNQYFSNSISRQIINNCEEQGVEVIVLADYEADFSKYVMLASGNWSSMHLSGRIREQLRYKAWQKGILVLETAPYGCGSTCAVCGAGIKKRKKEFICENGHTGNRYLNSARNLGRRCMESFAKTLEG